MSHQVKWVKRPSILPDDSGAAATHSRSPISWAAASRVVARVEPDASTRELPRATADGTGEVDLDDVLAVEDLRGRGPTVSVSATCELQAEDVLAVMAMAELARAAPISVAPSPWVTDALELRVSPPPTAPRRHVGVWIAAAASAGSLGVLLAAAAVTAGSSASFVLPRGAHHAAAQLRTAERLHARASQIPVVSLASLTSLGR